LSLYLLPSPRHFIYMPVLSERSRGFFKIFMRHPAKPPPCTRTTPPKTPHSCPVIRDSPLTIVDCEMPPIIWSSKRSIFENASSNLHRLSIWRISRIRSETESLYSCSCCSKRGLGNHTNPSFANMSSGLSTTRSSPIAEGWYIGVVYLRDSVCVGPKYLMREDRSASLISICLTFEPSDCWEVHTVRESLGNLRQLHTRKENLAS
jgi:hypothetical protein